MNFNVKLGATFSGKEMVLIPTIGIDWYTKKIINLCLILWFIRLSIDIKKI